MYVDVDLSGNTLQKKIRNAQIEQYNFTFGKYPLQYVPYRQMSES